MTDDLVTEARKGGPCAELGDRCRAIEAASGCFCAAVADRIEALTAERDRLRAALIVYADPCDEAELTLDGFEKNMRCRTVAALKGGTP